MELEFVKMEGLGNDFILLDDRPGHIREYIFYSALSKKLCSRHFGIGADGIILIMASNDHGIKFRIYNSDGSQAQMCGNGMRCFAKFLYENKVTDKKELRIDTKAGTVIPRVWVNDDGTVDVVTVDMGEPIIKSRDVPFLSENENAVDEVLNIGDTEHRITAVSMGNPHCVIFVENADDVDVKIIGPVIENHDRFPERTNVEFIEVISDTELKMKVWERGAGITLACGTGACASLAAAHLTGRTGTKATIHLDGGDLDIEWDKKSNHIFKTGPARTVFVGKITI